MTPVDPVSLALVWRSLINISEEMGAALKRTAFSPALREAQDFSASIHDASGRLVAHGEFTPGHTGCAIRGVPTVIAGLDEPLAPGDGLIYNELGLGGGHLPDVYSIIPIYVGGTLVGYSVCSAHHSDVGGASPGSLAIEGVYDVYSEGLRIEPLRHFRAGLPDADVFTLLRSNVRMPDAFIGDLMAQMSANRRGAERVAELVAEHGLDTVVDCMREILERSEMRMRNAIREVPNGRYSFTDYLDDHGVGTDPVPIVVALEISDDAIEVDFEGTGPQVSQAINSYLSFTSAYSFFTIKSVLDPHSPQSAGSLAPVTVRAPEGSLLNPRHPAPGAGRAFVLTRIVDVVIGALAQALPDRVAAAPSQFCNCVFGGRDRASGEPFIYFELLFGGTGARPTADGSEAMCSGLDINNIPVEVYEQDSAMRVERLALVPDSGGAGRWRGGCGVVKEIRSLAPDVSMTNQSDRYVLPAYGLSDGRPGALGSAHRVVGDEVRDIASKGTYTLGEGDLVIVKVSGAGGYGDPLTRDPQAVLRDVVEGYVTPAGAERDYGVIVSGNPLQVDDELTVKLRTERRPVVVQGARSDGA